jgi:hypothetical protein
MQNQFVLNFRKFFLKQIKLILCLSIISAFFIQQGSCSGDADIIDQYDLGISYNSIGVQSDIISELQNRNIPFTLQRDGVIRYSSHDKNEVENVLSFIDTRPSSQFVNQEYALLLTAILHRKNVPFLIRHGDVDGKPVINIIWDQKNDSIVKELKAKYFIRSVQEGFHNIRK